MYQPYSKQFKQVADASITLEQQEVEYPLGKLVEKASLSKNEVLQFLRKHWIETDDLDIVYLNLTQEEEELLYHS